MRKIFLAMGIIALTTLSVAAPVAAAGPSVQFIRNFDTVLAVRYGQPDFPLQSLMRANCKVLYRVQFGNGRAIETEKCQLSDEPVMIPEYQGVTPDHRVTYGGGKCIWISDFWGFTEGVLVYASRFRVLVTPRGEVFVTSTYTAKPLDCPDPG